MENYIYGVYAVITIVLVVLYIRHKKKIDNIAPESISVQKLWGIPYSGYRGNCVCNTHSKQKTKVVLDIHYCSRCGSRMYGKLKANRR